MTTSFDTIVIGGGIVGWSAAYRLAWYGVRAAVIDNHREGHATAAGAGIVSPGTSVRAQAETFGLVKAAVAWYPTLIAQLAEDGEVETGFASPGTLFVFTDEREYARLDEVRALADQLLADDVQCIGTVSTLSGSEARSLFPALGDIPGALFMPEGSRVDGRLLRGALRRAAIGRGVVELTGEAMVGQSTPRDRTLSVDGQTIAFDRLLLAAGAWTRELAAAMRFDVPVAPQRGQILHFAVPGVETSNWPVIHGFHNHYLLTFPRDRVVAGATREDGSGFDYRMTAGGVSQELNEALRVAPGLENATLAEIRIGFRPMSVDKLPILGRIPDLEHLYVATGHGPSGLTLGAVSGAAVVDDMLGHDPIAPLAPFSLARFGRVPAGTGIAS